MAVVPDQRAKTTGCNGQFGKGYESRALTRWSSSFTQYCIDYTVAPLAASGERRAPNRSDCFRVTSSPASPPWIAFAAGPEPRQCS